MVIRAKVLIASYSGPDSGKDCTENGQEIRKLHCLGQILDVECVGRLTALILFMTFSPASCASGRRLLASCSKVQGCTVGITWSESGTALLKL